MAVGVSGTDFICVPTQDFDKACEFYGGVLGLEESKQWGDMPAREYETGNLTIAIMQSDAFGQDFSSHTHPIALQVDDVEAARAELEGQDTIDSGVCHMAIFRDPDGNGLMLHHRYAPKGERGDAEGAAEKAAG